MDHGFAPIKRRYREMMGTLIEANSGPTKRKRPNIRKLSRKLSNVHIDGRAATNFNEDDDDDEDDELDDNEELRSQLINRVGKFDFKNYVRIMSNQSDKLSTSLEDDVVKVSPMTSACTTIDRYTRQIMDSQKLAVAIYNPRGRFPEPPKDSSDDEEFVYKDHKDFLLKPIIDRHEKVLATDEQLCDRLMDTHLDNNHSLDSVKTTSERPSL